MKDSHYRISLDIHRTQSQVSLPVKQGDTSRKVFISLCEGGKPYQIEDDCFAVFSAKKPDKTVIENNCTIADNVIEYDFTEQTSATSGKLDCEIKLYGGDSGLITCPRFTVIVDSRAVSDAEIESTSEYSALTALYTDTNALKNEVETKLANGEFNGKDGEDVNYNLVSNALKGTASGEVVALTDVSPLEHEIGVKLSSDSITDFSSVTLKKCGKNLIPYPYYQSESHANEGTISVKDGGGILFQGTPTGYVGMAIYRGKALAKSGKITLAKHGNSKNTIIILFIYDSNGVTLDTKSTTSIITVDLDQYPAATDWNITVSRAVSNEAISGIMYPQLEIGTSATDYEPYKETKEYTPNSDGVVEGVTSLYPTTILTNDTEGVTIDVEYNKDANKVIDELIDLTIGKTFVTDVTILANKWVGTASPYSQVVTVEGATKRSQVDLTPSVEQLSIFYNKDLAFVTENVDGIVTVYAIGQKPANDYTIQATITEVNI